VKEKIHYRDSLKREEKRSEINLLEKMIRSKGEYRECVSEL